MFPHQDRLYIYKDSFQDTGKKKSVYLGSSVVHQLHGPSSFVLDPHKYASFHIAGGELLKGFIPTHQDNLQKCAKTLLLFFLFFFANTGASLHRGTFMINTQQEHNAKKKALFFFCLNVISKSAAVGRRVRRRENREMTLFYLKLQFGFDELNNMQVVHSDFIPLLFTHRPNKQRPLHILNDISISD